MSIDAPVTRLIGIIMAILFLTLGLNLIRDPFTDIVTVETSEVISSTADASGGDTIVLSSTHFFTDTEDLIVVGATDGDVTSGATVGSDRKTLTLSTLTASTTQDITVTYLADKGGTVDPLWKAVPFFVLVVVVAAALGGGFAGGMGLANQNMSSRILSGVIVVLIGGILTGVQASFVDSTAIAYANAPGFTGITMGLPLIDLAYVLVLLSMVFAMFAGEGITAKARGLFQ